MKGGTNFAIKLVQIHCQNSAAPRAMLGKNSLIYKNTVPPKPIPNPINCIMTGIACTKIGISVYVNMIPSRYPNNCILIPENKLNLLPNLFEK